MMDWIHTKPPFGIPIEIFNHYGHVRRGVNEGGYMRLTDCTYPMQNACYPVDGVVAWRIAEGCDGY